MLSVTPYEKWNGKKPDLSNLRLFDYYEFTAYTKNLGQLRKFDDWIKKFAFVGYASNGYKLWDSEKRKIVVARDVKIVEKTNAQIKEKEKTLDFEVKYEEEEDEEEYDEKIKEEDSVEVIEIEEEDLQEQNSSSETDAQEEENNEESQRNLNIWRTTRTKRLPQRYGECAHLTYE